MKTDSVRLDKWLWAVRIFKSRSLAADACQSGRVTIAGQSAKPSRSLRINDNIIVQKEGMTLCYRVVQLLDHRVGAAKVLEFAENLTPPSEYEKRREKALAPIAMPSPKDPRWRRTRADLAYAKRHGGR